MPRRIGYTGPQLPLFHVHHTSDASSRTALPRKPSTAPHPSIWHHELPINTVLSRLATNAETGLKTHVVESLLASSGPNVLTPPPQMPIWLQFLSHFTDFFSLLLQFAAVLCVIAFLTDQSEPTHLYLGIFLYAVVVATSIFTFIQQRSSDRTLRKFRCFLPPKALTIRDGGRSSLVDASSLVVGDIVILKTGDKIPADVRILSSHRFMVDSAALTGESDPIELRSPPEKGNPLEATNLAFLGSFAVDGMATAVVIATGDRTVIASIARLATNHTSAEAQTTLQRDIHHFVLRVSVFSFLIGSIFFTIGVVIGTNLMHNLIYSIGIIVSNIPEGLLATVTVSLTASARRMARRNVLVKQLDAVETLGSTTVICTDKTGTLTLNKMTMSHISYAGRVDAVQSGWSPPTFEDNTVEEAVVDCFKALLHGASVCSTATFDSNDMIYNPNKPINERIVTGDPSEAGILRFAQTFHNVESYRETRPRVKMIPFNSRDKIMAAVTRRSLSDPVLHLSIKGAPEKVLERCTEILSANGRRPLTSSDLRLLERQVGYLAGRGERLLAFGEKHLNPEDSERILSADESLQTVQEAAGEDICFVGFISLLDPPREGAAEAVQKCKDAGIKVIMVSGDHARTARSVAQQVGIITKEVDEQDSVVGPSNSAIVVHGKDIQDIPESKWDEILAHDEVAFTRTSPQQKLLIVENLQRLGHVVTVTGDGCNDSAALKRANTGVSMGLSGSDVSREAANIVILDDNFASIVDGVEEGRLIFDNLKKSVAYTLASNVPQLIPFLLFITVHIPLPLTTILVLCIDLGTDIFPAIALAYERPEQDIMERPPRNRKKDRLLNNRLVAFSTLQLGLMQTFAGLFAYSIVFTDKGLGSNTLPGMNSQGFFGATHFARQRWLYAVRTSPTGPGFAAGWFTRENEAVVKYFKSERPGFLKQRYDRFDLLPAKPSNKTVGGQNPSMAQFQNMVKIIGFQISRPPCLEFSCKPNDEAELVVNDVACFDSKFNKGEVSLTGVANGRTNSRVLKGRGLNQGCFALWTPSQEREVLRHAQTAFFVAIVVAQMFTLLACKTRVLSVLQAKIHNKAVMVALFAELALTALLVYLPPFRHAFDIRPLQFSYWLPGIPFGVFILLYDEGRKVLIRRDLQNESGVVVPSNALIDKIASWVHRRTLW